MRISRVACVLIFVFSALMSMGCIGCECCRPDQTSASVVAASSATGTEESTAGNTAKNLKSADGNFIVVYSTSPAPLPLNEPFSIDVVVSSQHGESAEHITLEVDGRMPHHRHGMNRQPRVIDRGDGKYTVEGMLFHMPGRWELYFDITHNGITERAQDVIFLD